jgi:hypothetical protein
MTTLLLLLAIGQCRGGRCPAPMPVQVQATERPQMMAKDTAATREVKAIIVAAGYKVSDLLPDDPRWIASYQPAERAIRINILDSYWEDRGRRAEVNHRLGFNSTGHPDHILRHEFGHAELHKAVGDARMAAIGKGPLPLPAERIRATVSNYATQSPVEFHAEVFAGLKDGKTYPEDVMEAYAKLTRDK